MNILNLNGLVLCKLIPLILKKTFYIVVPPERSIIRRERDAGAYRLSAYYMAKITSELPLVLCAPLIFFSILYWMVGIGDATLCVIYVAVNLLFCLIVQVIILSFYLTPLSTAF